MMDAAQIPQGVADPTPKRLRYSAKPADPMSKVLDDDDLLMEIMVRLGFPTTLVRAALVCKRWFRHASDPTFLHRFRKLNPPRLLGFYVETLHRKPRRFMLAWPHPPELACVFRPTSFDVKGSVMGCRNGVVFAAQHDRATGSVAYASHYPLFPERGMVSVPRLPYHQVRDGNIMVSRKILLKEENVGASYCYVVVESSKEKINSTVHVYTLQGGVWLHASAVTELPYRKAKLVGNKIYMPASARDILVFDLTALTFSALRLPQGLAHGAKRKGIMMSRADDDSGVYFIKLDKLQLCVWLHKGDNCQLADTICLHEMRANLIVSDDTLTEKDFTTLGLIQVGDNAEFGILRMGTHILYLDIKRRTLRKVYEMANKGCHLRHMHPFMMIWPPSFPALKDDPARDSG